MLSIDTLFIFNMNPSHNLRDKKPDLSPFLFHFTSGEDPFGNINSIIEERCLVCKRTIKDYLKAVCFTESPLTLSLQVFNYMNSLSKPRFSKYGIGFKRDVLIRDYAARPVIYGDEHEYNLLSDKLKWRFEYLDVSQYDFQWLREWRIKGDTFDFSNIPTDDIIIITPTTEDLERIVAFQEFDELDFEFDHGETFPSPIYKLSREWKGVSFEMVSSYTTDKELENDTDLQEIGETIHLQ
ncbi:hypothetical protein [Leyella stercorea]|uniref:hypothetical protein n=1 Tax=Leyella stercorea TaxID=363265 RepID=UPI004027AC53